MKGDLKLEGGLVTLRSFQAEDAGQLVAWRNIPEVIQYFLNPRPVSMEEHLDWFYHSYLTDDDRVDFVITEKASGRPAGTVGAKGMSSGSPELSYAIGAMDLRGRGLAKDALLTVMAYVKSRYAVDTAEAHIHKDNEASRGFIEGLGFTREGKLEGYDYFYVYRRMI